MTRRNQEDTTASLEFDCTAEQVCVYLRDLEALEDFRISYIVDNRNIEVYNLVDFLEETGHSDVSSASILADGVKIFGMDINKSGNKVWKLHCDNKHGEILLEIKNHVDELFAESKSADQDEINVELRFRTSSNKDMIGYLVAADAPYDCGISIYSDEQFQDKIRGTFGGSARVRDIIITDREDIARAMARSRHLINHGDFIITRIADGIYAMGMVSHEDNFYDHVPTIIDSREGGPRLKVVGEFGPSEDMGNYRIRNETDDGRLILMDIMKSVNSDIMESVNPDDDPEPDGF